MAAPVPQAMDRLAVSRAWADRHAAWLSSSELSRLGDELTIRHKSVRYSLRSTDATAGTLPLCDANGTEILTLNFASTDRWSLQLSAKLTTQDGYVVAEYATRSTPARGLGAMFSSTSIAACDVMVDGEPYATIPTELFSLPSLVRADGSGGVALSANYCCQCCPYQTLMFSLSSTGPGGVSTTLRDAHDGCCCEAWLGGCCGLGRGWTEQRKHSYELQGDARAKVDRVLLSAYLAVSPLVIMHRSGGGGGG